MPDFDYHSRDSFGRFAPPMNEEDLDKYNRAEKRLREIEKKSKKEARLLRHESNLLLLLVDNFEETYDFEMDKYKINDIRRYKRKPYHEILLKHHVCFNNLVESKEIPGKMLPSNSSKVTFSRLVNRLEKIGWIRKIKHGKHLYIKITESGLKKVWAHYSYRYLGAI